MIRVLVAVLILVGGMDLIARKRKPPAPPAECPDCRPARIADARKA